jgi:glycosyltransferase involved in cell wall biosynthesis
MNVSVLIPAFNSSTTIGETIDSVLMQVRAADQVIVLDDGSSDDTVGLCAAYSPRIRVLSQSNRGVASARNTLYRESEGDVLAFLDADDVWHSGYLAEQIRLFNKYPEAVAAFTGHSNFRAAGRYRWSGDNGISNNDEIISPIQFCKRYNAETGFFGSMSFCCIKRSALERFGDKPFDESVSGADDFYLFNKLPLLGPVASSSARLVAYRCMPTGQSANLLKMLPLSVIAMEHLDEEMSHSSWELYATFRAAVAARRRELAKIFMGVGDTKGARFQLRKSISSSLPLASLFKSSVLLAVTYMPKSVHPKWPAPFRVDPRLEEA